MSSPCATSANRSPLSELLAAAGPLTRATDVARDQAVWDRAERLGVGFRGRAATHTLRLIEGGPAGPDPADHAPGALYDPVVLDTVSDVLFGTSDDPDRVASTCSLADRHRPPVIIGPEGTMLDLPDPTDEPAPPAPPMTDTMRQALVRFVEDRERQWCDQRVPALGGVTPRGAAADPTRRVELDRLIANLPPVDAAAGQVGMRPERLRALLDVPAG